MAQGRFGTRPPSGGGTNPMVFVMGFFFLIFSMMGAALFYLSLSKEEPAIASVPVDEPAIEMVDVIVPVANIKSGTALDPALFTIQQRPVVNVSSKVVRSLDQVRGMFAKDDIVEDQPLHLDFITSKKPTSDIVSKIPRGFRAISIRVDATTSVEGWAGPGAKVDVVWISSAVGEQLAKVIVEAAKILSVSGVTEIVDVAGAAPPSTVTLLVTRDDATKIQLAQTSGRLTLQLRNDDDGETAGVGPVQYRDIVSTGIESGQCKEARRRGVTRVKKPNGEFVDMVLDDEGKLVSLEKMCASSAK